jgi:hypothetical protein
MGQPTPEWATRISIRRPGRNFRACSASPTTSLITPPQYQNGVEMHFDWGASQFLTKQFQIGLVGYVYDEAGCDSGSGDRVGCFQSRVVGLGPQVEFIIPMCRLGDLGRVAGTPDCPIRSGGTAEGGRYMPDSPQRVIEDRTRNGLSALLCWTGGPEGANHRQIHQEGCGGPG